MSEADEKLLILAIDIGSSSVRCAAYDWSDGFTCLITSGKKLRVLHPGSGRIYAEQVADAVDGAIDETIDQLKNHMDSPYKIIALGLSSFVMNLVGVGEEGELLGDEWTLSYACNTDDVSEEVRTLKG